MVPGTRTDVPQRSLRLPAQGAAGRGRRPVQKPGLAPDRRPDRRVLDDGCGIAERTLVTIGDHCTLNAGSVIQCHSMEEGIFEADYTVLEDG